MYLFRVNRYGSGWVQQVLPGTPINIKLKTNMPPPPWSVLTYSLVAPFPIHPFLDPSLIKIFTYPVPSTSRSRIRMFKDAFTRSSKISKHKLCASNWKPHLYRNIVVFSLLFTRKAHNILRVYTGGTYLKVPCVTGWYVTWPSWVSCWCAWAASGHMPRPPSAAAGSRESTVRRRLGDCDCANGNGTRKGLLNHWKR